MISSAHKFIFVHVPKTGGNSIQTLLEPVSDDRRTVVAHQDGIERFDVVGPATPRKHATLAEYGNLLGDRFPSMKVVIGCRHPLDRLASAYFSPHRWFAEADGKWERRLPHWDLDEFLRIAQETVPAVDFLKIAGKVRTPDFIIRFEDLQDDFSRFVAAAGIPLADTKLPHRNASGAPESLRETMRRNGQVLQIVEKAFREDFDFFGYTISPPAAVESGR
jgi:hypothetical protein